MLRVRFIPRKEVILMKWFFLLSSIRGYRSRRKSLGKNPEKGGNFEI